MSENVPASTAPPVGFASYAIAVGAVALAAALTGAIENRFGSTYLFFYPAVVISAAMGGIGPGILATVAPPVLVLFWILPARGIGPAIPPDQAARAALFVGMGAVVSLGFEFYRRAVHRAAELEKQAALRASEGKVAERDRHLRTVLDTAQDGFWMIDGEGRLVDANPAACAMTGYGRDELLRKNVAELKVGEIPAAERIRQVQEQGSARFDSWLRRKDGALLRVAVSMSATGLAGGLMVSFFRDVTRRREIEEDLRRARRTLLMITRCDEAILRASGEEELLAEICRVIVETGGYRMCWVGIAENDERRSIRPVAHAGHEDGYLAQVDAVWSDAPRGRGPIGVAVREGRIVVGRDFAKDPTLAPWKEAALRRGYASATAVPIAHGGEKVGVLVLYSADVAAFSEEELRLLAQLADDLGFGVHALRERAARARADVALSEEQDRFRALIERSSDLTLILDGDGTVLFASPASIDVLGMEPRQGVGKLGLDFVHPDDLPRAAEELEALRKDPATTRRMELRVLRADGSYALVEVEGRNLADVPGVRGIVVNGRDISERNRLRDQLQHTQKLDSIGRLAGGVAHDFNNLLTVMLSCGDDLRRAAAEGTPPAQETIEDLVGAGQRARDLTGQLLAFARRQPIAPLPLDLDGEIRDGARMLRRAIGNQVELVEDLQAVGWRVRFDPGLLGQVLMNLALNARDAMPGGGRLVLSTRNVTLAPGIPPPVPEIPPGDYVRLGVKDSGTGMTPAVLEHLFEPFFTTKPPSAGTGLGLSTVYGIVKQGGAWLGVRSSPGEGSEFRIWFPRDVGD